MWTDIFVSKMALLGPAVRLRTNFRRLVDRTFEQHSGITAFSLSERRQIVFNKLTFK